MKLLVIIPVSVLVFAGCLESCDRNRDGFIQMEQKQITFSPKTHALDNNDNFSPDGRFLCYDTRGTVKPQNRSNIEQLYNELPDPVKEQLDRDGKGLEDLIFSSKPAVD